MPARVSRNSLSVTKPRTGRKKQQKRSLNALSIAAKQVPDQIRIRQHRLGETQSDGSQRKRRYLEEDDEEEDDDPEEARRLQHKKAKKDRFEELDIDEGSDSEGHTWQMGHVDDDDDSDLDSDEAFGESDEERFEGFTFRGSSSTKAGNKSSRRTRKVQDEPSEIDLDEEEDLSEEDDDSLGEDAVDLATMLDDYDEDEDNRKSRKAGKRTVKHYDSDEGPSEEDDLDGDGASDLSMSEEDEDEDEPSRISRLQGLISSLQPDEEPASKGPRGMEIHESSAPSEFGLTASQKLKIEDLLPTVTDPGLKKSLKLLRDDIKPSKRNNIPGKLEAPLPKRQQDRLDRAVASQKAKETLDRWVDTVKQNRRAEHISFPLQDPDAGEAMGASRLIPTSQTKPLNDLESTIQSILEESGLSTKDGKSEEEKIRAFEELQTNKLPLEEVQARRAELRKSRELLFREEIRAKRIKKIKSKAYRRVHRKERERLAQREKDALAADGINISEDEREYNDRRRAEERMGAKHRESKWAKGVKQSGKAAWDEDARAGVTEMARRNEELRKRIEGKGVHNEDEDNSDISSGESDDDEASGIEDAGSRKLQRQLARLNGSESVEDETSKLGSMKFMQRAEAARRARNDEDFERMRRELASEESQNEEERENAAVVGRRKFGPTPTGSSTKVAVSIRNEFEEFEDKAGSDDGHDNTDTGETYISTAEGFTPPTSTKALQSATAKSKGSRLTASATDDTALIENAYLVKKATKKKGSSGPSKGQASIDTNQNWANEQEGLKKHSNRKLPVAEISAPDTNGWQTVTYRNQGIDEGQDEEGDDNDDVNLLPFVLRNQELTARGFAGDDVEADFEREKKATIADEDEKVVDNTLPGWGNWVGDGVSKREKRRGQGKVLTKTEGIRAEQRKDAKLDRVIINEKRVKKNGKFLASSLPFPFESRQQYERSLRLPKGPEWTTKQSFQDGTKPRVLLKQGIIKPMEKPLV
ncbi:Utp14-domain-containing protein [Glonium stellatum]|uniref:Utp14-domain-containing protein n=1 Tax=Glonium stellatum TaxID=574774 RepID=A0A8E2F4L8_9PEZI|nr:Utp14-domain-containing protein [Glonium stellatum]